VRLKIFDSLSSSSFSAKLGFIQIVGGLVGALQRIFLLIISYIIVTHDLCFFKYMILKLKLLFLEPCAILIPR